MTQTIAEIIEAEGLVLPTLDLSRSFGTVHNSGEADVEFKDGAAEQDGFLFRADRTIIVEAITLDQLGKLREAANTAIAMEQARAVFRQTMPNMSEADVAKLINIDNLKKEEPEEEIDLVAWANGKPYNFTKVNAKIRTLFGHSAQSKNHALEVLAAQGLIPPRSGFDPMAPAGQR